MDILERIAECRSKDITEIAAAFADADQDDVTRALVSLVAERTDRQKLEALPFNLGFTLYGDADVSSWVVQYRSDGFDVTSDGTPDLETRWEHWEDCVRLLNGDLPALSLLYARRLTLGEGPTTENEPAILRAIDFAPGSAALAENRVLTELMNADERGQKAVADYLEEVGLQAVAEARTLVVARGLLESGCADELRGTYMAVTLDDNPAVLAVACFEADGVRAGTANESSAPNGVLLRYATQQTLIDGSTGTRSFQDLLVNGLVKVDGDDEHRGRFARSLMNFARLHGI